MEQVLAKENKTVNINLLLETLSKILSHKHQVKIKITANKEDK